MITFKQHLQESLRILPDERVDQFISNEWDGAVTYKYNAIASMKLAKVLPDVIITKDKEWMHIPGVLDAKLNKEVSKIEKEYNLKQIDESLLEEGIKDIFKSIVSKVKILKDLPKLNSIKKVNLEDPERSFNTIGKEIGVDSEIIEKAKRAVKEFKDDSLMGKIGASSMSVALSSTLTGAVAAIIRQVPSLAQVVKANPQTSLTGFGLLMLVVFLSTLFYFYKED